MNFLNKLMSMLGMGGKDDVSQGDSAVDMSPPQQEATMSEPVNTSVEETMGSTAEMPQESTETTPEMPSAGEESGM